MYYYSNLQAYSHNEIISTEQSILSSINFRLCFTSPLQFLHIYTFIDRSSLKLSFLARYFIEEFLVNYNTTRFSQNIIACSALFLANKFTLKPDCWSVDLEKISGTKLSDLRSCARTMCLHLRKSRKSNKLTSARRKFSGKEYLSVAIPLQLNKN